MLIVTNAVFDRTEHGVEEVFVNSFTGDAVIRPKASVPLSLFGDETPVTGELTDLNRLVPYSEIEKFISLQPSVSSFIPQVSGHAVMEKDDKRTPIYLFGVGGSSYLEMMPAISITAGKAFSEGEKGVMLSEKVASQINASVGDIIQFTIADGPTFRIRAVPVTAVYVYSVDNSTLDRIALVDPSTVRSLMDITETADASIVIDENKTGLLDADLDLESLFENSADTDAVAETETGMNDFEYSAVESDLPEIEPSLSASTAWNFLICTVHSGENAAHFIRRLNKTFRKNGWPVEAVNWRNAAGSTALYLYWMRLIFNTGILIVLAAGLIVVNNTLVINVLDRTREIGTMRAVGASRVYVSLQFMLETFIIAVTAGIAGCILGSIASYIITDAHITFSNSFLIQLFGGNTLVTAVTLGNLRNSFFIAVILGFIGWIYPVQTALAASPVQAMQGGS